MRKRVAIQSPFGGFTRGNINQWTEECQTSPVEMQRMYRTREDVIVIQAYLALALLPIAWEPSTALLLYIERVAHDTMWKTAGNKDQLLS